MSSSMTSLLSQAGKAASLFSSNKDSDTKEFFYVEIEKNPSHSSKVCDQTINRFRCHVDMISFF